jgi:peptide methionine sulfoxide reductase msrA/msrB
MKYFMAIMLLVMNISAREVEMDYRKLTEEEKRIIENKGTEHPFSGKYHDHFQSGIYKCKRCGAALFKSEDKFQSGCGWPSFDDEIPGAVTRKPDPDGFRTEIICSNCAAHLGHVFTGEQYTAKNTRHCVNSISLVFEPAHSTQSAYVAGGCFWGVEYYMQQLPGVISAESGYMGGAAENPDYYEVSTGTTGHAETVKVTFDPEVVSYSTVIKRFFEIHDPTQLDRQGPDFGNQYRSAVFYLNQQQKNAAQNLIDILKSKGYNVVTELIPAAQFYKAERYHQDYYNKNGRAPYCHKPVDRFK